MQFKIKYFLNYLREEVINANQSTWSISQSTFILYQIRFKKTKAKFRNFEYDKTRDF